MFIEIKIKMKLNTRYAPREMNGFFLLCSVALVAFMSSTTYYLHCPLLGLCARRYERSFKLFIYLFIFLRFSSVLLVS